MVDCCHSIDVVGTVAVGADRRLHVVGPDDVAVAPGLPVHAFRISVKNFLVATGAGLASYGLVYRHRLHCMGAVAV